MFQQCNGGLIRLRKFAFAYVTGKCDLLVLALTLWPFLCLCVAQECISYEQIPETVVEYASGTVGCDSSSDQLVRRALQLGVLCGSSSPGEADDSAFVYEDLFLECGLGNAFDFMGGQAYTCLSSRTVPANSNYNVSYSVDATKVMTDYRWPVFASDRCYSFQEMGPTGPQRRDLSDNSSGRRDRGLSNHDLDVIHDMMIWS